MFLCFYVWCLAVKTSSYRFFFLSSQIIRMFLPCTQVKNKNENFRIGPETFFLPALNSQVWSWRSELLYLQCASLYRKMQSGRFMRQKLLNEIIKCERSLFENSVAVWIRGDTRASEIDGEGLIQRRVSLLQKIEPLKPEICVAQLTRWTPNIHHHIGEPHVKTDDDVFNFTLTSQEVTGQKQAEHAVNRPLMLENKWKFWKF